MYFLQEKSLNTFQQADRGLRVARTSPEGKGSGQIRGDEAANLSRAKVAPTFAGWNGPFPIPFKPCGLPHCSVALEGKQGDFQGTTFLPSAGQQLARQPGGCGVPQGARACQSPTVAPPGADVLALGLRRVNKAVLGY